jgi:hypothetical protein
MKRISALIVGRYSTFGLLILDCKIVKVAIGNLFFAGFLFYEAL